MKEKDKFHFVQWDKRVMERDLRSHRLLPEDIEKHVKVLQDDASHGEEQKVYEERVDEGIPSIPSQEA